MHELRIDAEVFDAMMHEGAAKIEGRILSFDLSKIRVMRVAAVVKVAISQTSEGWVLPEQSRTYPQHASEPATSDYLDLSWEDFLAAYSTTFPVIARQGLQHRPTDHTFRKKLGRDKTPYLVRDFLEDFPTRAALLEIYGVGRTAAMRFTELCRRLKLPFDGR